MSLDEPKTHLSLKLSVLCGIKRSLYQPLKVTDRESNITCETCKKILERKRNDNATKS